MKTIFNFLIIFLIVISTSIFLYSKDSDEDYRTKKIKGKGVVQSDSRRDRPMAEISVEDKEELIEELRGAVRDEIDNSLSKERKASDKKIDKDKLIKNVRKIVRQEIDDAIRIKEKNYLSPHTVEVGGFFSFQTKGLDGSSADNNMKINVFPMFNYFITSNFAVGIKGEASFNFTTGDQSYNGGIGPQYTFGVTKDDSICLYTGIYLGASKSSALTKAFGYRYSNEFGVKYVMNSGVIFNAGVMIVFDNGGDQQTGFQNILVPAIGISAWF